MLAKILGGLTALGAVLAIFFRSQLQQEKIERKEEEIKRAKSLQRASDKATEALIRGLDNESKPISRGYFNKPE